MSEVKTYYKKDWSDFWDIINRKTKSIVATIHKSTFSEKYVNRLRDDLNNGKKFK